MLDRTLPGASPYPPKDRDEQYRDHCDERTCRNIVVRSVNSGPTYCSERCEREAEGVMRALYYAFPDRYWIDQTGRVRRNGEREAQP